MKRIWLRRKGEKRFDEVTGQVLSCRKTSSGSWKIAWRNGKTLYHKAENVWIETISEETLRRRADVLGYLANFAGKEASAETASEGTVPEAYAALAKNLEYLASGGLDDDSALRDYLDGQPRRPRWKEEPPVIFPFGCNKSQKAAVETALRKSLSVIEGPPGTGKTQTILNLLANLLIRGKRAAVVSNNNSATDNVWEKLEREGLGWLVARLGRKANQEAFFAGLPEILLPGEDRPAPPDSMLAELSAQADAYFESDLRATRLRAELSELRLQTTVFQEEEEAQGRLQEALGWHRLLLEGESEERLLSLSGRAERFLASESWLSRAWHGLLLRLLGVRDLERLRREAASFRDAVVYAMGRAKEARIASELAALKEGLPAGKEALERFVRLSRDRLFSAIARRYRGKQFPAFDRENYRGECAEAFEERFPVITSSVYALSYCVSRRRPLDYVIADEASQVGLPGAAVCMGLSLCMVASGDSRQLPQILPRDALKPPASLPAAYDASEKNLLDSLRALAVPVTLLREHYRCHPDIIEFCNRRFYGGELVVMTDAGGRPPALEWREVQENEVLFEGGSRLNERQAQETSRLFGELGREGIGPGDIGVVSPYRLHANRIAREDRESDTVHRFQGREKPVIIFNSVLNAPSAFSDDPHLVNVAVSRARDRFILAAPRYDGCPDSNLGSLERYIEHLDPEKRRLSRSPCRSVFDALFARGRVVPRGRRGESPAETLFRHLLQALQSDPRYGSWSFVQEYPLRLLPRRRADLSGEEVRYMERGARLDFLLFDRMDRSPVLAIEVDGNAFHRKGGAQAGRDALKDSIMRKLAIPLCRFRTNTAAGGEEAGLAERLTEIYARRNSGHR